MKRHTALMLSVLLGALAMIGCAGQVIVRQPVVVPTAPVEPDYGPAVDMFYDDMSPYGSWVMVDGPGWVWRPEGMAADWRPYTLGRWVYTEYGWTWASEEPWGWAAYHYGRWHHAAGYGWVWAPGTEWGPAWVTWHSGNGWIGWAPLPWQVEWRAGTGLYWGHVDVRVAVQPAWWCFVATRHMSDPRPARYIVPPSRNVTLINITKNVTNYTIVDNRVFNGGIHVNNVGKAAGRPVPRARVRHADGDLEPGGGDLQGNEVVAFKPGVRRGQQPFGTPGHARQQQRDRVAPASDESEDFDRPAVRGREQTPMRERPTQSRPDDRNQRGRSSRQGQPPEQGPADDGSGPSEETRPSDEGRTSREGPPWMRQRPEQGRGRGHQDTRGTERTPEQDRPQGGPAQDDAPRGRSAEPRNAGPGPKPHPQPAVDETPRQGPGSQPQTSGPQTAGPKQGRPRGKSAKPGGKQTGKPGQPAPDDKGADKKPEGSKSDAPEGGQE